MARIQIQKSQLLKTLSECKTQKEARTTLCDKFGVTNANAAALIEQYGGEYFTRRQIVDLMEDDTIVDTVEAESKEPKAEGVHV